MIVTNRSTNSFEALIRYTCPFVNTSNLIVTFPFSQPSGQFEFVNSSSEDNVVGIRFDLIDHHAGRNWAFTIASTEVDDRIVEETFTVTLQPRNFTDPAISFPVISRNATSVLVRMQNCAEITSSAYLRYRCDPATQIITGRDNWRGNCLMQCDRLTPGSNYSIIATRLPIPIADQFGQSFPLDTISFPTPSALDRISDVRSELLPISVNVTNARIHFTQPRQSFDQIELNCSAIDQRCESEILNGSLTCPSCSSFDLLSIIRGVQYRCYLSTIKAAFPTVLSDLYIFNTSTLNDE